MAFYLNKYKNLYKSCFRSSKQTFFKESTDSKTADPSKMLSTVKSKIDPNSNTSITSICVASKTVDSLKEILDYFEKIFLVKLTGFALIYISVPAKNIFNPISLI